MGDVAEENLFDVTSGRNVHGRGDVLNFMLYLDTYHGLHYLIYHLEYWNIWLLLQVAKQNVPLP